MHMIADADRIAEFDNIADFLIIIDAPAKMLKKGGESYLVVALPTMDDVWDPQEMTDDGHFATLRIRQPLGDRTKYLTFSTRIRADLAGCDERRLLGVLNDANARCLIGTLSLGIEDGSRALTYSYAIGAARDGHFSEIAVCDAILEMGKVYDSVKAAVTRP